VAEAEAKVRQNIDETHGNIETLLEGKALGYSPSFYTKTPYLFLNSMPVEMRSSFCETNNLEFNHFLTGVQMALMAPYQLLWELHIKIKVV
jgi:hypothetical protein